MKHFFTSLLSLLFLTSFAQNIPSSAQQANLKQLENKFQSLFETNQTPLQDYLKRTNQPARILKPNGGVQTVEYLSPTGMPIFYQTLNLGGARTVQTNKVWPGGIAGTSLTGNGMTNRLGIWDGGRVLTTHQEFGSRVSQIDGTTTLDDHATHVAGTMVATGVSANAKGMSYQAPLKAYYWDNDASEMTAAAAAGMILSNHSYGQVCGWQTNDFVNYKWYGDVSVSATKDYRFGFYDNSAAQFDEIAFNAPNYLICQAAGNDRDDKLPANITTHEFLNRSTDQWVSSTAPRDPDGPYDCMLPSACAKNVLTVGAINELSNGWVNAAGVTMSSFSDWGPTDDGRIKPDVVAKGVGVYSTVSDSNDAYDTYQGTSMATPVTTGSLLLVQQHYNNLKGKFMRSASLKGLIIHTVDEAGPAEGPDYSFGWGVVNTFKAVKHITDSNYNQIQERTLASNATFNQGISSDGTTPLKVTICWTDRAGTPPAPSLNPTTRMLVNDLDIRITRSSDNTVYLPYILNPASPASPATKGDNNRDNVEQIFIAAPTAGAYTITVSHKGTLAANAAQNYSLIISGIVGKPAAAFTANVQNICSGQNVTFTDQSGGNPTGRTWYFPGGNPSTSSATAVTVNYANAGTYPVALKVSNALGIDSFYSAQFIKVGGLSLPFNETFENSSSTLSNWTIQNPNNDSTWRLANVGGSAPGNQAYCMPFYNYGNINRIDALITPPLNFKGYTNINLSLKHAYTLDFDGGRPDSLKFYVSTDCGSTWTLLNINGGIVPTRAIVGTEFSPTLTSDWCSTSCYTINLSAYSGMSNIRIKFEAKNNHRNNLYIDNVSITGDQLQPVTKFGLTNTAVCAGLPVTFFDSTDNNPASWNWTFTGASTTSSTLQNPVIIYNTPGTYSVKLRTVNGVGVDSLTKTDYVTVLPSPNKPNVKSTSDGFCVGDSVLLSTDSVSSGFQWYNNNILINAANASSYYATLGGNYNVYLIGSNGCAAVSSVKTILSGNKPDMPVVTTNLSSNAFCEGGTATLTSSAATGNQWYKNGSMISGQTAKTFATQDSGAYVVRVISSGCPSDPSNQIDLSIKPKPLTSAIATNDTARNNADATYNVAATTGSTYQWTITNGTVKSGAGTASVVITWGAQGTGKVAVQETAANGCKGESKTLDVTVFPKVGLEQLSFMQGIKVFPNPMHDELTVTFINNQSKIATVKLVNIVGQTVSEEMLTGIAAGMNYTLDVSKLNAGIYFIEISSSEGTKQVKLIKK